jgi:acetyltransferase-like isoleucine patch superfamily enzyme
MSVAARAVAVVQRPFMLYGYYDRASGRFRKYTRISSSVAIANRRSLSMGDSVWIWHYSVLDATAGLTIEEGCQIGASVGIFTHGSQNSIRLLGREFVRIPNTERKGYTRGKVMIGAYTFIGSGSIILPGVTIGKGCLIGVGAVVSKDVPDYSIVTGNPGQVRGSTIDIDERFFRDEDFSQTYYDAQGLAVIRERLRR